MMPHNHTTAHPYNNDVIIIQLSTKPQQSNNTSLSVLKLKDTPSTQQLPMHTVLTVLCELVCFSGGRFGDKLQPRQRRALIGLYGP